MLLKVMVDTDLSGAQMDAGSEPLPRTVRYGDRTVAIAYPADPPPVQTASLTHDPAQPMTCRVSESLSRQLRLPANLCLHRKLEADGWRLGPCLGVYTRASEGRPFASQTRMLEDLVELGAELGVDVVVLTPGFLDTGVGWRYHLNSRRWQAQPVPLPDIVLRRAASFPSAPATAQRELRHLAAAGRLHTLAPEYGDKWRVHQELSQAPSLSSYLPLTRPARSVDEIVRTTAELGDAYVKPTRRARGASIVRVLRRHQSWEVTFNRTRRTKLGRKMEVVRRRLDGERAVRRFWNTRRLTPCIVQQTIPVCRLPNGQPVDFRWLVQFIPDPVVTARIARVGRTRAVTTNLHTGGRPATAESVLCQLGLDAPSLLQNCDDVVKEVACHLSRLHHPFVELGIDLAISPQGQVYLLEVNPTPGRRMLRLLGTDVREMSLRNWLEYAINAAGFRE
ncbi:YheC/YheD family endospore coat-associated protein [Alicyclobacillus shizuokensis]|uniref:YheC/YheD family endospore coat-associated protein n=1 Tax=Alicyclobacillus shizuokensis TaxID=392014 RepID=UPI000831A4D6|nr:YheC/YheD family protein [Alicyclobacillus shizuokensis]MCL6626144.1 YheC/YheD family protein [Alicyclobacillus shizuokensis]